jgi:hypothetical protein
MALQFSTAALNDRAAAITTAVGNAGYLEIWTGAIPANCGTSSSGTKLVSEVLSSPFAPAPSGGVLSPTLPSQANAVATGTAGYWRVFQSDDATCVIQGTCGTSGTDMILNSTSIVTGGPVEITAWTLTEQGT